MYASSVGSTQSLTTNEWYEDVKIADKMINVQLDTGAKCNVISIKDPRTTTGNQSEYNKVRSTTEVILWTYHHHKVVTDSYTLSCEYKRKKIPTEVKF